jgi:hypothetical protein
MNTDRYDAPLLELNQILHHANVSQINRGEFFGYFLDHLIHRYIQIQDGRGDQFNANLFPAGTRKSLDLMVQRLAALVCTSDPVEVAADLLHIVVQTIKGITGTGITQGMSLFLKGCIVKTLTKIQELPDTSLGNDPKDRVMASRRRIIALGVLTDALGYSWLYRENCRIDNLQAVDCVGGAKVYREPIGDRLVPEGCNSLTKI